MVRLLVVVLAGLLAAAAGPVAAAHAQDFLHDPASGTYVEVAVGSTTSLDTGTFTVEAQEQYELRDTYQYDGILKCPYDAESGGLPSKEFPDVADLVGRLPFSWLRRTAWFDLVGTGETLTVTTRGSDFDTVLVGYEMNREQSVVGGPGSGGGFDPTDTGFRCNQDIFNDGDADTFADDELASEVRFPSAAGGRYAFQVGGCWTARETQVDPFVAAVTCEALPAPGTVAPHGLWSGNLEFSVHGQPANDARADAVARQDGAQYSTLGATEEPGTLTCNDPDVAGGPSPFGKTVWFSYTAPETGTATFTAAGFDTVLAAYRGTTAAACDDDAPGATSGGASKVALQVAKGEVVLVQVGGYGTGIRADSGALVYGESFARADADRDGFSPPQDCDDANAAVNPSGRDVPFDGIDQDCAGGDNRDADGDGAPSPPDCDDTPGSGAQRRPAAFGGREVPGNGVDEDCDGVALDVDGDGAPAPADCDDTPGGGAQRRPAAFGGVEVPGNGVDEDCAGGWAPARLEEPNVRIEGRIIPGRGLLVRRIRVERVRRGAQVRLLCRGRRCLRGTSRRARRDRMVLDVRDRVLPAGTVLEVRVWVPGAAGRYIAGRSVLKQVGGTGTTLSCARTLRAGTTQPAEGCRPR